VCGLVISVAMSQVRAHGSDGIDLACDTDGTIHIITYQHSMSGPQIVDVPIG